MDLESAHGFRERHATGFDFGDEVGAIGREQPPSTPYSFLADAEHAANGAVCHGRPERNEAGAPVTRSAVGRSHKRRREDRTLTGAHSREFAAVGSLEHGAAEVFAGVVGEHGDKDPTPSRASQEWDAGELPRSIQVYRATRALTR